LRPILGLVGQFAELRASAMKGCFHRGQAEIHHLANLLKRATEHIHQDHARSLGDRKPHEGTKTGACDLAAGDGIGFIGNHIHLLGRSKRLLAVAAAQEIQRGVVRDPEQPAFRVADRAH